MPQLRTGSQLRLSFIKKEKKLEAVQKHLRTRSSSHGQVQACQICKLWAEFSSQRWTHPDDILVPWSFLALLSWFSFVFHLSTCTCECVHWALDLSKCTLPLRLFAAIRPCLHLCGDSVCIRHYTLHKEVLFFLLLTFKYKTQHTSPHDNSRHRQNKTSKHKCITCLILLQCISAGRPNWNNRKLETIFSFPLLE